MRNAIIEAGSDLLGKLPSKFRGRTRMMNALIGMLGAGPAILRGKYDLSYIVPSLAEPIARGIISDGYYEPVTHAAILEFLPSDGTFLDIGANIGAISLPVAQARARAKVFAIEASPTIYPILTANVARNALTNVCALNFFAGKDDGGDTMFFEAPGSKFGMGSAGPQFGGGGIHLPVHSIDALLARGDLDLPDVIKIDIEGAEYLALSGGASLLASDRRPRAVIFEFNDWAEKRLGLAPGASQELMLSFGYELYDLSDRTKRILEPARRGALMVLALS